MDRAAIEAFLTEPRIMLLTANRDGNEPFVAPVWYEYRDGQIHLWVGSGAAKTRLVRRNPAVTLAVQDERFPYKAVLIRGTATVVPGFDRELAQRISRRYLGEIFAEVYCGFYRQSPEEAMATIVVRPAAWRAWDYSAGLHADRVPWIPDAGLR